VQQDIRVECLPGATAFVPALVNSGLPITSFCFEGFLPLKKGRQTFLKKMAEEERTMVFYESPMRLVKTLSHFIEYFGVDRMCCVSRELTKKFEDIWPSTASGILARLQKDGPPKGEIVLVIGRNEGEIKEFDIHKMLQSALSTMSMKEAVAAIVEATGLPKKQVYNAALEIKNSD
jgi:16S rRNA (cytidine1402-2'-O)-methyltransferase